jgi:hypothetical protein
MAKRGPPKTRVKTEPDGNTEMRDLTYHIKDRVELMKRVFSIASDEELVAMAPNFLRDFGLRRIRELLLDEVLGISSKRLHSVLEGYRCPTDTDTDSDASEADLLETVSLDSISSDDDVLLQEAEPKKKVALFNNFPSDGPIY